MLKCYHQAMTFLFSSHVYTSKSKPKDFYVAISMKEMVFSLVNDFFQNDIRTLTLLEIIILVSVVVDISYCIMVIIKLNCYWLSQLANCVTYDDQYQQENVEVSREFFSTSVCQMGSDSNRDLFIGLFVPDPIHLNFIMTNRIPIHIPNKRSIFTHSLISINKSGLLGKLHHWCHFFSFHLQAMTQQKAVLKFD